MLRAQRSVISLVRHLMIGTAGSTALVIASSALVGCKDESQPEYWVEKLAEKQWQASAIKRLEQFYDDAYNKAGKKSDAPEVKALVDKIVAPLTQAYVDKYDELDQKSRVTLIKLICTFRDPRGEAAFKKAFEEFIKKPATSKDDTDVKWVAMAVGDMKLTALADLLVQAFTKLRASSLLGGVTYKDYLEALRQMPQKSWTEPLKTLLQSDMEIPKKVDGKDDPEMIDRYRDQQLWQTGAAELLGELREETAVEPLLKALLDPQKADVAATAVVALVKIGKPAQDRALKLLASPEDPLAVFWAQKTQKATGAKEPPKDNLHVATAALVVGTIGRAEAIPAMVDALKKADKDVTRTVIARELTKIPGTPDSKAAFKTAFEAISSEANIPPGYNALQLLAESAAGFYDAGMIDWLLERAEKTKGEGEALKALQGAILVTALKLAKPDQLPKIKAFLDAMEKKEKGSTQFEAGLYAQAEKLLKECGERAACYLSAMEKSENQEQKNQFVAIKAGYMLAIYGNEQVRDHLIAALSSLEQAAIRHVAAGIIDFLSPKGSKEAADKLDEILKKNRATGDANKIAGDNSLRQVSVRIRSRAG